MSKLVLRNVSRTFGSYTAVDNLNLTLHEGEFVSLLGPSGCGKTTTLRMIAGFIDADRRHDRAGRPGDLLAAVEPAAGKAADVDDLPELRDLAEHDGGGERRLRPQAAQDAARTRPSAASTRCWTSCSSGTCATAIRRS